MSIAAKDDSGGSPAAPRGAGTGAWAQPAAAGGEGDEVVRPGDEHRKGAESLCVGESQ